MDDTIQIELRNISIHTKLIQPWKGKRIQHDITHKIL